MLLLLAITFSATYAHAADTTKPAVFDKSWKLNDLEKDK
jgi:hypothetical protein